MKVNIGKFNKKNDSRKIEVKIDKYDTWNLDITLSYIILPALLQLKATKHGIPSDFAMVGGEEYLDQKSFDFYAETVNDCFEQRVALWDEVLDKMIWSFNELISDDYTRQYYHGKLDYDWVESDKMFPNPVTGVLEPTYQLVDRDPDGHWCDHNGLEEHEKRIQEGIELFAKYFRNLWD